jgi:uncharacterized protein
MPVIASSYQAPRFLRNGHVHTIYPALFRIVSNVVYRRERFVMADGDFMDLDWSRVGGTRVVIVAHGLEGSSRRSYVRGMVRAFNRRGWDAVALNFRGCSGEPNRLLRFYHSGVSEDLWEVAQHVAVSGYERVDLVGFSLGGNVTLKLLGELGDQGPDWLGGGVGVSVPCDLRSSSELMGSSANRLYMGRFIRDLHRKIRLKQVQFPGQLDDSNYGAIRTFRHFDDRYTAPLHGFRDAEDYWEQSSCRRFLDRIRRPSLLLNAADDPFLAERCFPTELAAGHRWVHLEVPDHGGHVGFVGSGEFSGEFYSERRTFEFISGCG